MQRVAILTSIGPMPEAVCRNPDWEWDETVLACDLVFQNDWQPLPPEDQRVVELSAILRRMSLHPPEARLSSFRNEDGVAGRHTIWPRPPPTGESGVPTAASGITKSWAGSMPNLM